MKKSYALLPVALVALSLSACGKKDDAAAASAVKLEAGPAVPPPAGSQWSAVVVRSPEGGYLKGNPKAAVKIAEYGSYTCPHCADFMKESAEEIDRMVDTGKVSFEFRPFVRDPLDMTVALLAACGGPEAYFPLAHQFFANQAAMYQAAQAAGDGGYQKAANLPADQRFVALAQMSGLIDFSKQRGLSESKAKQCLANGKEADALVAEVQHANETYTITGTPTIILNGKVAENVLTWPDLRAKLKEAGL